jgi:hypothetical protein
MMANARGIHPLSQRAFLLPQVAAIVALVGAFLGGDQVAANPWVPLINPAGPFPNNVVLSPNRVPGKDFSDVRDRDELAIPDPQQVVAWDGSGGVRDSHDYNGTQNPPLVNLNPFIQEVDGIAAGGDALFQELRDNQAALVFSVEGDARVLFERETGLPASPPGHGVWATPAQIDAMNNPVDTDGLELWGGDQNDDSDRYSLAGDPFADFTTSHRKVAVWSFTPALGPSTPHTFTSDLASSISLQLGYGATGPVFGQLVELLDVDAIMAFGPQLTFSIRPISFSVQVGAGPVLITFDGGEIFEYDGPGQATEFLNHGGHLWDTGFNLITAFPDLNLTSENIDALEAVAGIPEPSTFMLAMLAAMVPLRFLRRRDK